MSVVLTAKLHLALRADKVLTYTHPKVIAWEAVQKLALEEDDIALFDQSSKRLEQLKKEGLTSLPIP